MKGNPIIFLDFDGVLNSHFYAKSKKMGLIDIDEDSVVLLNQIVQASDAKVVVSSTWRLNRTIQELEDILLSKGFIGEVIDKTKDLRRGPDADSIVRGNEILCWMKDNPAAIGCPYYNYTNYIILDDDSDMLYSQRNNFIHVDPYVGITPRTVFQAKKILGVKIEIKDMF